MTVGRLVASSDARQQPVGSGVGCRPVEVTSDEVALLHCILGTKHELIAQVDEVVASLPTVAGGDGVFDSRLNEGRESRIGYRIAVVHVP